MIIMAEYLDKTGLTYLWSKIKAKFDAKADKTALDAKADDDKYKIMVLRTKKEVANGTRYPKSYKTGDHSGYSIYMDRSNSFQDTIPDGYFASVILSATRESYYSENDYNNSKPVTSMITPSVLSSNSPSLGDGYRVQTMQGFAYADFTEYGFCYKVTVLLQKKGTPAVPQT